MSTIPKPPVNRIATIQLCVLLALTGLILLLDITAGYSVLLGGLIQVVPGAYFAHKVYRYTGARQAAQVVRAMYRGEAGKIVLSAALFAAVFATVRPLNVGVLLVAYLLMFAIQMIATVKLLQR